MSTFDRRDFLGYFSSIGLGSTLLPGALWTRLQQGAELTPATIKCAEEISGLTFDDAERELMVNGLKNLKSQLDEIRKFPLPNAVPPAIQFNPLLPGMHIHTEKRRMVRSRTRPRGVPSNLEELAFAPVTELSELVRARKVSSVALTEMYLARLRKHDESLKAVITLTEDRALAQARQADADIARGKYRGPLHGIPWGAKDLLAVKGYPTTWGTAPYREQRFDDDATVVKRLDAAGAVLVAKLTLGELAQGDTWFGGMTRNPWKRDQGSSGSSAGSSSATAAGLVGFAIGSETLGSISSPATRNGVTGLRPTFGRVPRTGAMALSWTMDKLGPICRSVEDCALVLDAIHGPDGQDLTVQPAAFNWDARVTPNRVRIGYTKRFFDLPERETIEGREQTVHGTKSFDDAALAVLERLGAKLIPVELPEMPYNAVRMMLTVEAAAAFDELTRSGRDAEMAQQGAGAWPNTFRTSRFAPAVEYVNASRIRTLIMQRWAKLFETVDVIVTPTFTRGNPQLTATNLTGHPAVILPHGFREFDANDKTLVPVSLTFLGNLYDEARLLAVAHHYQQATDFHLKYPSLA